MARNGLRLTWGNAHKLLFKRVKGRVRGKLFLQKTNGKQGISILVPEGITLPQIQKAWKAQGGKWADLITLNDNPFSAVRAVWMPDQGIALVWYVLHLNDRPIDAACFQALTQEEWTFGSLQLQVVDAN